MITDLVGLLLCQLAAAIFPPERHVLATIVPMLDSNKSKD